MNTPRYHAHTRSLLATVAASIPTMLTALPVAVADPITYELSGAQATFLVNTQDIPDQFTGTFTFDAANLTLSSASVTESATGAPPLVGAFPAIYTVTTPTVQTADNILGFPATTIGGPNIAGQTLTLTFQTSLSSASDLLSNVSVNTCLFNGSCFDQFTFPGSVFGEAVPISAVPAPALGSGAAGLAVLGAVLAFWPLTRRMHQI